MKILKYLIISATESRYGGFGKPTVTLRETLPKLRGNEISLRLALDIPDKVFKRPQLEASMAIPEEVVPKNLITPEVRDNIEKVIKEATGLDIFVSLVEHEEKKQDG